MAFMLCRKESEFMYYEHASYSLKLKKRLNILEIGKKKMTIIVMQ